MTNTTDRITDLLDLQATYIDAADALWTAVADALACRRITGREAAALLEISRATLYRRLDERGLMVEPTDD